MELRRLRYFLRVAAIGSLAKASDALGVAQPALGRQIQILESELGVKLFLRVPKGMCLTEEGEYLKSALEDPLELVNIALRNVRSYGAPVDASLVLGLPPVIAEFFGPRLVTRFQEELPNLRLRVTEGESGKLAAELAQGLVDIALLIGTIPDERVFHSEVLSEQLMLVVPPSSDLARQESRAFRDLRELPLILPGPPAILRTKLAKAELAADITLNITLEIDSVELTKKAVRAGYGFAILPPLAFKVESERGELIGIPIVEPEIDQIIRWAVRPLWRVPRDTYDRVERAIFHEWFAAVSDHDWPAKWLFDLDQLALPTSQSTEAEEGAHRRRPMLDWHRF